MKSSRSMTIKDSIIIGCRTLDGSEGEEDENAAKFN
jgi:hypothetical protein